MAIPQLRKLKRHCPFFRRVLKLYQDVNADVEAEHPGIRQPERPSQAAARIVSPSRQYTRRDVAFGFRHIAELEVAQEKWADAATSYGQAAAIMKEVVEQSPTVGSFATELAGYLNWRAYCAMRADNRSAGAAFSRDAVEFWNRQVRLHPDIPGLRQKAADASKLDSDLSKWPANPSTQP
jgi:hypothetical protein